MKKKYMYHSADVMRVHIPVDDNPAYVTVQRIPVDDNPAYISLKSIGIV